MQPRSILKTVARMAILTLMIPMASIATGQTADSAAITSLLSQVKTHAALADDDAATLVSYSRSNLSWRSHATKLNIIKEHANDLIKDYNDLASMRAEGSPWQQEAIDRINPLVREMADHLTATIQHLNDNQNRVQMKPFRDYVQANHELMSKTHQVITDFVEYGESKTKAESLESKLELPDSSTAQD